MDTLKTFSNADNPGRCNEFMIDGARVIVDFAHNPHGMKAFMSIAKNLEAERKILVTGQAGDRSDTDIRNLAQESIRDVDLDRVIIKQMAKYARGRKPGETAHILKRGFIDSGLEETRISVIEHETDAVNQALDWAQPGDLVLLLIHENRSEVLDILRARSA